MPKKPKAVDLAPKGWKTTAQMASEWNIDISTARKYIKRQEKLKTRQYKSIDGFIRTHYSPATVSAIFRDSIGDIETTKLAPAGWMTLHGMADLWKLPLGTVKAKTDKLHGLKKRVFKVASGGHGTYYNPEAVSEIYNSCAVLISAEKAPRGWMHLFQMETEWGICSKTIMKYIRRLKGLKSQEYISANGSACTYYAPDSVTIIHNAMREYLAVELAPKDWMTAHQMALAWKSDIRTVYKYINKLQGLNAKKCKSANWLIHTYYSPESTVVVHDSMRDFLAVKSVPKGWMSLKQLAREIGIDSDTIKNIVSKLNDLDTEKYRDSNRRRIIQYYSPESVKRIISVVNSSQAPKDWMNVSQMAAKWKMGHQKVTKSISKLKGLQSKKYKSGNGLTCEYYSPKSIMIIHEILHARKNPPYR